MSKSSNFAVAAVSLYLLIFTLFVVPGNATPLLSGLAFALAPVLLIWMVFRVLTDRSANIPELENNEHWGYQDRRDIRPVQ